MQAETISAYAIDHSKACIPPIEPPATITFFTPKESSNFFCTFIVSSIVITGKSSPYSLSEAGFKEQGPVVPEQPPNIFEETTKYLLVSKALSGPIISFHQPKFLSSAE